MFLAKKSLYRDLKGDKYVIGVIRDITDLKQNELMAVQQIRQAALGETLDISPTSGNSPSIPFPSLFRVWN